jgi:hypothetical protein
MQRSLVLLALLLTSAAGTAEGPPLNDWRIQSVQRTKEHSEGLAEYERVTVHFSNGRAYEIPLYRAEPIAVLHGSDGTPFLLASGADCTECDENKTLRFFVLGEKDMRGSGRRHTYPGSLTDYMSPRRMEKTRTFYGRCLNEPSDVVVWFQEYIGEDDKWHKASSVARMARDGDTLAKLTEKQANLSSVVARVKGGACTEISGIDGTIEP